MRYVAPEAREHVVGLLVMAKGEARLLAGGTDLLVQLRTGLVAPELVIGVGRVPEMQGILAEEGGFRIGAAVPSARLGEHRALAALWPGVVEAMALVGSTQIQERATLAGNLCNASPAADSVPAMIAAAATVRIVGPNGVRDAGVGEIATGPGQTSLARGEYVESVFLPARPPRSGDAYLRFIPRTEMDIAVVGAAVSMTLDEAGSCIDARVALGAVAPTAIRVEGGERALVGSRVDDGALAELAAVCTAACRPIDDKRGTVAFRKQVAGVLARRAAVTARERAGSTAA